MNYWTKEDNDKVLLYMNCVTASTSAYTRNYILNDFYTKFKYMANIAALKKNNNILYNYDDMQDFTQDCVVKCVEALNKNKIKKDKVKGSLQYFYNICTNAAIDNGKKSTKSKNDNISITSDFADNNYYMQDDEHSIYDADVELQRKMIIDKLNADYQKYLKINLTYSIFIELFKNYCIEKNFNVDNKELKEYIVSKMNIHKNTYTVISRTLGYTMVKKTTRMWSRYYKNKK